MKKTPIIIFFFLVLTLMINGFAFAEDYIEAKGRGILSGKIISENEKEVIFRDSHGITLTFPKSEITLLERGKSEEPAAASNPFSLSTPASASRHYDASVSSSPQVRDAMQQIKRALKERAETRAANKDIMTKINLFIEGVYQWQVAFFVPDTEALTGAFMEAVNQSHRKQGSPAIGIAGIIIVIVGAIGLMVCGFKVLTASFRQGATWGFLLLGNSFMFYLIRFGESAIFISHVLNIFVSYFFITRFNVFRKLMIFGLICLNLILAAVMVLRLGFTT